MTHDAPHKGSAETTGDDGMPKAYFSQAIQLIDIVKDFETQCGEMDPSSHASARLLIIHYNL